MEDEFKPSKQRLHLVQGPYSYHNFTEFSKTIFRKVLSKNFGMIFWKLHIPAKIDLRIVIYTSNES